MAVNRCMNRNTLRTPDFHEILPKNICLLAEKKSFMVFHYVQSGPKMVSHAHRTLYGGPTFTRIMMECTKLPWKMTQECFRWQSIRFNESFYLWWHQFFCHSWGMFALPSPYEQNIHIHASEQPTRTHTDYTFPHNNNPEQRIRNLHGNFACIKPVQRAFYGTATHPSPKLRARTPGAKTKKTNKSTNQSPTSFFLSLTWILHQFSIRIYYMLNALPTLRTVLYLLPISSRLDFPSSLTTLWRINVTPAAVILRYICIDRTIVCNWCRLPQRQRLIDTSISVVVVVVAVAVIVISRLLEYRWRCGGQALIHFAPHSLHCVFGFYSFFFFP